MVLDPIPQSLPAHFFGSRPQPPTSQERCASTSAGYTIAHLYIHTRTQNTSLYMHTHIQLVHIVQTLAFIEKCVRLLWKVRCTSTSAENINMNLYIHTHTHIHTHIQHAYIYIFTAYTWALRHKKLAKKLARCAAPRPQPSMLILICTDIHTSTYTHTSNVHMYTSTLHKPWLL